LFKDIQHAQLVGLQPLPCLMDHSARQAYFGERKNEYRVLFSFNDEGESSMETHGVTVRTIRILRGPNLFAYMPVLQITLDIGPYEERPSNTFPGFVDRLVAWLPGLEKHECS